MSTSGHYRSKTLATWIAVIGGVLGLHRFYMRGLGDIVGWLHPLPTFVGLIGIHRLQTLGQDDRLAWALIPVLGIMITVAMGSALYYALTPDEKWDDRHNGGRRGPSTSWGPVIGAIVALMLGAGVMMGTIAYGGQKFFEGQLEEQRAAR